MKGGIEKESGQLRGQIKQVDTLINKAADINNSVENPDQVRCFIDPFLNYKIKNSKNDVGVQGRVAGDL